MIACVLVEAAKVENLWTLLAEFSAVVEVEVEASGIKAYVDLGPGKPSLHEETAQLMREAVEQELGLQASIGVAHGKFTAHVAAAAGEGSVLLVPAGREAAFLAPFPVDLLPLPEEMRHRLRLLGLYRLGQLAALPPGAVQTQFGKAGYELYRWAKGQDRRPVVARRHQRSEHVRRVLDGPVNDRYSLRAVLEQMVDTMVTRLRSEGWVGQRLHLVLHLDDGTVLEDELVLRHPMANPQRFNRVLQETVEQMIIGSGVVEAEISLSGLVPAVGEQLDLFSHGNGQDERLHAAVKDLLVRYVDCFYQTDQLDGSYPLPECRFALQPVRGP